MKFIQRGSVFVVLNCIFMHFFFLTYYSSMSEQSIEAIAFNSSGDWIGLGCSGLGQLLVWEWQSESYVLKQQAHFNNMSCLAYSPDGQYIVTGGDDAKVFFLHISILHLLMVTWCRLVCY